MKTRRDLPQSQLYESIYAPVQTYEKKKNDEDNEKIKALKREEKQLKKFLNIKQSQTIKICRKIWGWFFGNNFAEEWIFLAILGILMGLISYGIDKGAFVCNTARQRLYVELAHSSWAKYFAWISLPCCLTMFGAGLVKFFAPKAAGGGVPEIKTILRGVYIENFLTFPCLFVRIFGIIGTLGSGMPLGREGSMIHISSCIATLLGKLLTSFHDIYQNKTRKLEIIGAAAAVGVACTFGAPIGGVLLSVEITTSYYAVRNYWRGFCAAIWGATFYRLLLVWIDGVQSVTVIFKTNFFVETPFAAQELVAFAILGVICGLGGALYVKTRLVYNRFLNNNRGMKMLKSNPFVYTFLITLIISSITFPLGIGQFLAGALTPGAQTLNLFSNFTWGAKNLNVEQQLIVNNWQTKYTGFYLHLVCFIIQQFFCSIIGSTMPIPNGTLAPNFRIGASIGRIMGELMYIWYPNGVSYGGRITTIISGGYAMVGAAAFVGAVTQRVSIAIMILEMTGQISHVIPILIAVLLANGISQFLGSSIYDSVIKAKGLPYLPDLLPTNSAMYNVYVEDFMIKDVVYLYNGMTFKELKNILLENKKSSSFPLVNNPKNMILLGSITRYELIKLIKKQIGIKSLLDNSIEIFEKQPLNYKNIQFIDNPVYEDKDDGAELADERNVELKNRIVDDDKDIEKEKIIQRIVDLPLNEQKKWIENQMQQSINFSLCHIDPAPFQLVEHTSLLKVHSLFSMIGLNSAYVTTLGRLVGVVRLKDLKQAIDDVKNGKLIAREFQLIVNDENNC